MMRIASWNVNGLRSLVRRDFQSWLNETAFDVVCLQEVKTEEDLLTAGWFTGYEAFWNASRRRGHSGVATLVRTDRRVTGVTRGIGLEGSDVEGRVLTTDVGGLRIINLYAPHSHRKLIRLDAKMEFLRGLSDFIERQRCEGPPLVLVGDFNIAHREIDLANPKANVGNAGFLPVERRWLDGVLAAGFQDAFRKFEPGPGHYTWWSMRQGVRSRNVGWRLDYVLVEDSVADRLLGCSMIPSRTGSDHCPVVLDVRSDIDGPF